MKNLKKILLPFACKTFLKPKGFSKIPQNIRNIDCDQEDVVLLTNTSNNVFRVKTQNGYIFFRECKIHKEIYEYVNDEIDFYYSKIHPELLDDKLFIQQALNNRKSFKKFINMGIVNDFYSGAYNFCIGNGGKHIGILGMEPDREERIKDFVQYIWGELFVYKLNNGLKIGEYQTYNAARSIAVSRLAKLLGLRDLIPNTEYALLNIRGKTIMFGTAMDEAAGICMETMSVEDRNNVSSPALQRALNNLNLLDVICFEKDHRPGNYNVVINNGKATNVVAFDNDSPNSFGIGGICFETYLGCSPMFVNNSLNRPFVDKSIVDNILNVDIKDLCEEVSDFLNIVQIYALKYRVKKIKKILKQIPEEKLLNNEWNEKTMKTELKCEDLVTYLTKFISGRELPYQPWIKN